ncbi:MAG: alpha/beta hydrolase [Alphaproteobacteria bacterium]|nr:alpha/beta hydrolase [Alphaproteobacteria bacterium]
MTLDANSSATLQTLKHRVREMGPRFDEAILQQTRALYQPLLPRRPETVTVRRDVAYGADARQRLDLYAPAGAAGRPVLIYVPGGGFVAGDKWSDDGFYANIGHYFAGRGFVVLVINYRLAPAHPWPAGGEDVGGAVAWAVEHARAHGGDAGRLAIFGQSAGASHTLTWLFDPVLKGTKPISALILSSGSYRVGGERIAPNLTAYYGADPSQYAARSPMTHVGAIQVPVLLTVSEFDPPYLASPTFELAAKLTNANGRPARLHWLAGHNHVSQVASIGTADGEFASLISDFLKGSVS